MSKIPPHIIDTIMQTARIEEVIGEFVHLKKRGSNYMGLSPFTDEKTPSFSVSPSKQIFKCFSTGKGGTVVSFLMEKEHFSYPEALKWLANKYNIELPEEREPTAEEIAQQTEKDSLFIINEFAKNHFHTNLIQSEEGRAIGLSYFEERGFRRDIIEKFQLGYSINESEDFTKAALAKGYKIEFLEKVGLTKSKDDRHFDFFRGRVMFPIQSISGRVLGFGGRTLFTDKKIAKYFNSPESPVYNKSEILYGLYHSKGDIVKYDECFLCEGYTDVISMYQAGIHNVVSSSGTSLTKEQVRLVKRYTPNITILYDGDAAGIKASFRGIDLILEEGMNVKVVLFPDGEDPDSYSKRVSAQELENYIKEHKQDFITFKASILLSEGENDPLKRAELIREIIHSVSIMPEAITRQVYSQEISKKFDIDENLIASELLRQRKQHVSKQLQEPEINELPPDIPYGNAPTPPPLQLETVKNKAYEKELMRLLLKYWRYPVLVPSPEKPSETNRTSVLELVHHELSEEEMTFEEPVCNKIYQIMVDGLNEKIFHEASFFLHHEDQEIVRFVTDIETEKNEISPNWLIQHMIHTKAETDDLYATILGVLYHFKFNKVKERVEWFQKEIERVASEENSETLILELLRDKKHWDNARKTLAEALGISII